MEKDRGGAGKGEEEEVMRVERSMDENIGHQKIKITIDKKTDDLLKRINCNAFVNFTRILVSKYDPANCLNMSDTAY